MNSEPNWLDIEDELYPELYVHKVLHVQINVTEALADLVVKYYDPHTPYQVMLFDPENQRFKPVALYPFKEPVLLKGVFVQDQLLVVKLESRPELAEGKGKGKTEKTVKYVVQKVAQWRKIYLDSQKKVTLEEAANVLGISRNTLDDYYFQIKLGEKHGFDFQGQLEEPFQSLRKFVKLNEEKKLKTSSPLPSILSKYQPK